MDEKLQTTTQPSYPLVLCGKAVQTGTRQTSNNNTILYLTDRQTDRHGHKRVDGTIENGVVGGMIEKGGLREKNHQIKIHPEKKLIIIITISSKKQLIQQNQEITYNPIKY